MLAQNTSLDAAEALANGCPGNDADTVVHVLLACHSIIHLDSCEDVVTVLRGLST